ncbi:hypothetical protein EON63_20200 [archaeon]|nr:MAG: hypothetical protein EON63_20200 [archaeon]
MGLFGLAQDTYYLVYALCWYGMHTVYGMIWDSLTSTGMDIHRMENAMWCYGCYVVVLCVFTVCMYVPLLSMPPSLCE